MARLKGTSKIIVSFRYTGLAWNVWQACNADFVFLSVQII